MTEWSKIVDSFAASEAEVKQIRQATHKRCIACQHSLPLSEFYQRRSHGGHWSRCKSCYSKKQALARKNQRKEKNNG